MRKFLNDILVKASLGVEQNAYVLGTVGIGTSSPGYKLTVSANGNSWNVGPHGAGVDLYSTGNIAPHYQSTFDWYTGAPGAGTFRMRLDSTGNLGIGTTSPGAKLDVNGAQIIQSAAGFGTDGDQAALFLSNTANYGLSGNFSGYSRNLIKSDGGSVLTVGRWNTSLIGELSIESGSSGLIKFLAGGSERMRITSGGNVGIGTTSPAAKLDVVGTLKVGNSGISNGDVDLWSSSNGIHSGSSLTWRMNTGGGNPNSAIARIQPDVYNPARAYVNALDFYVGDWNNNNNVGNALMSIMTSGNVGIGTTYPTQKLHVVGSQYTTGNITVGASGNYSNVNFVRNDGAGVGGIGWRSDGIFYVGGHLDYGPNAGNNVRVYGFGANLFLGNNTAGDVLTITNAGNVGIGTSSPGYKLQVVGEIYTNYRVQINDGTANLIIGHWDGVNARIENSGGRPLLITSYSQPINMSISGSGPAFSLKADSNAYFTGSLGIGTSSPSSKLHVVGESKLTGSAAAYTFFDQANATYYSVWYRNNNITYLYDSYLNSNPFVINASGNVGIGTTSPSSKLDVIGEGRFTGGLTSSTSFQLNAHYFYNGGGINDIFASTIGNGAGSGNFAIVNTVDTANTAILGASNGFFRIGTIGQTASSANRFVVDLSTGAATFSSSVTATQYNILNSNQTISIANTSDIQINAAAAGSNILFRAAGDERMRINASGNVGIGTTSPTLVNFGRELVISQITGGQPEAFLAIQGNRTDDNNIGGVNFYNNSNFLASVAARRTGADNSGSLTFNTSNSGTGSEKMRITSGGNVLVGTTSDVGSKLYVDGTIRTSGALVSGGLLEFTGAWSASPYNPSSWIRAASGVGLFLVNNSISKWAGFNATSDFIVNSGDIYVSSSSGNVGIGTSSPSAKLEVIGVGSFNNAASSRKWLLDATNGVIQHNYNGTVETQIGFNGGTTFFLGQNVGIGTTSPLSKVHIEDSSPILTIKGVGNGEFGLKITDGSANTGGITYNSNTGEQRIIGGQSYVFQTIHSGGSERMRITSGGNVGIGTTSPAALLHINGSGNTFTRYTNTSNSGHYIDIGANGAGESFVYGYGAYPLLFGTNGSERMRITSGGEVLIGTTSDAGNYKLQVNGNTYQTNASNEWTLHLFQPSTSSNSAASLYNPSGTISSSNPQFFVGQRFNDHGKLSIWRFDGSHQSSDLTIASTGAATFSSTIAATGATFTGAGSSILIVRSTSASGYATTDYFNSSNSQVASFGYGNASVVAAPVQNAAYIYTAPGIDFVGYMGGGERLRIASTGAATFSSTIASGGNINVGGQLTFTPNEARIISGIGTFAINNNANNTNLLLINNSTGNVGIGTSSPGAKLDVETSAAGYAAIIKNTSAGGDYLKMIGDSGNTVFEFGSGGTGGEGFVNIYSDAVQKILFDANGASYFNGGNIGIGTSSPARKLTITGGDIRVGVNDTGVSNYGSALTAYSGNDQILLYNNGSSNTLPLAISLGDSVSAAEAIIDNRASTAFNVGIGLVTNGVKRLYISQAGNVGIGTTSPSYKLHVEGNVSGISIYASHDIAAFSDITVKKEVKRIENAIEKVKELNGYTYVRTDDETGTRRAGVIAQEVQKVLPEVVSANPDGTLNVAYSNMIALLIEGMKEQQATIERLENRIKQLEK
jgi:hypothetical protein